MGCGLGKLMLRLELGSWALLLGRGFVLRVLLQRKSNEWGRVAGGGSAGIDPAPWIPRDAKCTHSFSTGQGVPPGMWGSAHLGAPVGAPQCSMIGASTTSSQAPAWDHLSSWGFPGNMHGLPRLFFLASTSKDWSQG